MNRYLKIQDGKKDSGEYLKREFKLSITAIDITAIPGIILFNPFVELVKIISVGASLERTLANAHLLFNVFGVLVFIWTIPWFEQFLNKILPERSLIEQR